MIARLPATAAATAVLCMFAATAIIAAHHPAARFLVVVPLAGTIVWVLFAIAPRIMPRGSDLLRAQSAYATFWLAATSLLAISFGLAAARALGANPSRGIMVAAMGVALIVMGNVCPKLPPNRLMGVRSRWALDDDEIWDKTQRLGGWCLVIAGFITINAALLLDPKTAKHVMLASILTVLATVMLASWNWARLKQRAASEK